MRAQNSCGPDAMAFAADKTYAQVDKAWGITNINKFSNLCDSPWHHLVAAENLGVNIKIIGINEGLAYRGPGRVVVLLHVAPNGVISSMLAQHWVVLCPDWKERGFTFDESLSADKVFFFDGSTTASMLDGTRIIAPICVPKHDFIMQYAAGNPTPQCCYVINDPSLNQTIPWYARWYVKFINFFFGA